MPLIRSLCGDATAGMIILYNAGGWGRQPVLLLLPEGNRPEVEAMSAEELSGVKVVFVMGALEALALAGV